MLVWLCMTPYLAAQTAVPPELISYPDTILHNGKILTVDASFSIAQAVAIRDGKFLAVGSDQDVLRLKGPQTKLFDLRGRTVVPGFVQTDADNDLIAGNLYKDTLIGRKLGDGIEAMDKAGILKEMSAIVATRPAGEDIFFRVPEESMDALKMTRQDLDSISPKNPLAMSITSSDMVVNSLMLAKLVERMPLGEKHPAIIKDASGRPTGQIYGQATGIVGWDLRPWPVIDEAALEEQKKMFLEQHKQGITSMVAHTQGYALSVVNVLYRRNELTMRLFASHDFLRQNPYAEAFLRRLGNIIDFGLGDMVKIVGAGLASADGNADIGSALTLEPKLRSGGYAFAPHGENKWIGYGPHPEMWETTKVPKEYTEWNNVMVAARYGYNTTGIHNVGDGATQLWLESINDAMTQPDMVLKPWKPFGMDHNLFWHPKNEELMLKHDVRRGLGKMWQRPAQAVELYGDKIHDIQPVPTLIRKGFRVHIEGAGFPVLQRYITRRDQQGRLWGPDQAIDRPTALRMVTLWAARYIAEDSSLGSIEKGKLADLVVLNADYLTVPEDQIGKIGVEAAIVGGRVVYGSL
ncbi:MAG TPA: amidohydrolase family protein [Terriglobia bacterium]|nr:amidohydrolase family protein [Terriglobia bacterium]